MKVVRVLTDGSLLQIGTCDLSPTRVTESRSGKLGIIVEQPRPSFTHLAEDIKTVVFAVGTIRHRSRPDEWAVVIRDEMSAEHPPLSWLPGWKPAVVEQAL